MPANEYLLNFAGSLQEIYTRDRSRRLVVATNQFAKRHKLNEATMALFIASIYNRLMTNPLCIDALTEAIIHDADIFREFKLIPRSPRLAHTIPADPESIPKAVLERRARKAAFRRKQSGLV